MYWLCPPILSVNISQYNNFYGNITPPPCDTVGWTPCLVTKPNVTYLRNFARGTCRDGKKTCSTLTPHNPCHSEHFRCGARGPEGCAGLADKFSVHQSSLFLTRQQGDHVTCYLASSLAFRNLKYTGNTGLYHSYQIGTTNTREHGSVEYTEKK